VRHSKSWRFGALFTDFSATLDSYSEGFAFAQIDSHIIAYTHFYNQKQIISLSITIAITVAVTMSKSKAPEYPKFDTQTPELCKAITTAIAAIPADHWVRPRKNELFADLEDGFIHIYN
jgi:hypothetical protein